MSDKTLKKEDMDKIIDMQKQDVQQPKQNSIAQDPLLAFKQNVEISRMQLGLILMQQDALSKQLNNISDAFKLKAYLKEQGELSSQLEQYINGVVDSLLETESMKNEKSK